MIARDIPRLTGRVANLIRENPQGAQIRADVLGKVEEPLATSNRATPLMDSDNPETGLARFKTTLEFAISPHPSRHVHAGI